MLMELSELQQRAIEISDLYAQKNKSHDQRDWDISAYMQGFVGDVGDLAKLVMAKEGYGHIDDIDEKLAHELADCLWSILVIAEKLDIPLEQAFTQTMQDLEAKLK